jgi:hypothetical protein
VSDFTSLQASGQVLRAFARTFKDREGRPGRATAKAKANVAPIVRRTAIHEAGHAVAWTVLHGPGAVEFATVVDSKGGDLNGFVRFRPHYGLGISRDAAKSAQAVRQLGIVTYAGVAAEFCAPFADVEDDVEEYLGVHGRDDDCIPDECWGGCARWEGSENDREGLEKNAAHFGLVRPASEWRRSYWTAALRLLAPHWHALHAVAAGLLQHGKLAGEDVDRIVMATEVPPRGR